MDSPPNPEKTPKTLMRLWGAAVMAVGGLIAALCGLCSLALLGSVLFSGPQTPQSLGAPALMILLVGGVPTAIGVAIFLSGLNVYRNNKT